MRVKFWGTRGSVPTPGRATEKFGGNTTCVEVNAAGQRLILDGGTGIRELGLEMAEEAPGESVLLFSHFHWDHIQGLPFFQPLFDDGHELRVCAPPAFRDRLEKVLNKQMAHDVFPVDFGDLSAKLHFETLDPTGTTFGEVQVSAFELVHPGGCWAYRVVAEGRTLVFATDHEMHPERARPVYERLREQTRDAHLLVCDGQYTLEEYPRREGWGHSTIEHAVMLAREAGVERLAITHHDPMREDVDLSELERQTRKTEDELQVFFARDGLAVTV